MVMETPSPQCVGREFVRQYYTLLNEAPAHLHRFYSSNSSFVHGGVEPPCEEQPPIIGQLNIHKKILSLNFRDCHAKIRQVDSQATVGNAVVVQVSGELSNNGQQMRRFMQTFILAPQSHKKYYVHNDIFRYQDEVYRDTDSEPENIEVNEMISDSEVDSIDQATSPETVQETAPSIYESAPIISNGSAHPGEPVDAPVHVAAACPVDPVDEKPEPPVDAFEEQLKPVDEKDIEIDNTLVEAPSENKPVTWSAIAGKNSGGSSAPAMPSHMATGPTAVKAQPPSASLPTEQAGNPLPQRMAPSGYKVPQDRARDRERNSVGRGDGDGDSDSQSLRRLPRVPDNFQLFVGNLPNKCDSRDLKSAFDAFGAVTDVRITAKATGAFAFVTFDGPETVRNVLDYVASKPIQVHNVSLNVEEKKPREAGRGMSGGMRGARMGGGMGMGRGGGGPMARGGARGAMRGDARGGAIRPGYGGLRR